MAKLTLSVDDEIIRKAKERAKAQGVSVSQMVSVFFSSIASSKKATEKTPPILRRLTGILAREKRPIEKYREHLERKYL
jgi:Family of unknown function (DUF6364)